MRGLSFPKLQWLATWFAVVTVFPSSVLSQSDVGSIVGFVRDPSGAVVPNVKVVIRNEGTNEAHTVTTNEQGHYAVPDLQPALYSMSAEAGGFKKFESTHNRLNANSTISLDASLEVGATNETVEVTATASLLQTESGAVQSQVTEQQIQAQELNGRNPLYMAQLLPGMRSSATFGDFNFSLSNGGYSVNGSRQWDSLITLDGAPATRTRADDTSIGVPNPDATQEIQVLTSDYSAEYGRTSGGQIRIVTKSGTTDFHGTLFEYFRNSAMNANTWTRNLSPLTNFASPFQYNDFGFDIGGPVFIPKTFNTSRQKFFFFVAQEWTRYRQTDTQTQAVPTALMRQGDFSELLQPNPWYASPWIVYDPSTCPSDVNNKAAASCVPFPNNKVPASRLSPNGLASLNAYPGPTPNFVSGTQNWIAQAAHPIDQRKGTYNGDFLPNEKHHIEFRRTDFGYHEIIPFDQGSGLTPRNSQRPNQTNTLAWLWTISPTMINEARISLSVDDSYVGVVSSAAGFNRSQFGINYPYLIPNGKDMPGKIPTISVPTFYSLAGGPYPSHSSGPIYTASDSLTKVWGNHTFKTGFYIERSGENDEDQINVATVPGGSSNQNGTFVFSDARTGLGATSGVGLANVALGLADSYTEIGPRAYTIWRGELYEWFAQDAWKVNQKLHVDYGIRNSINVPFYALWYNADYFNGALYSPAQAVQVDPKTGNVILGTGNQYNGVVIPGAGGFPSSAAAHGVGPAQTSAYNGLFNPNLPRWYEQVTNQFQPRLGLAYQLDSKTVLRGGIGRFLTRLGLLDNIFPGGNSPFQPFVTVNNVSVDNPGLALTTGIAAPLTITTKNPNLKPPEAWNWNVTVQREMFWNTVLTAGYVAHRGLHELQVYDINQPTAGALQANPGVNVNYLRPYKGFAAIQEEQSAVNSMYNSLQVTWNRRFTNGSSFGASYTFSKSMDGGSNYRDIVPDTYNTRNLWGPSEYDTRHAVVITYTYDLPFFRAQKTLVGKILGGWELNGIVQFQTGTPCGVGTNTDYAGVGEFGSFGCGTQGQFWILTATPTILGNFAGPTGSVNSAKYFATTNAQGQALFSTPPPGTFNTQTGVRDVIYGPGFQDWNIGLFKKFAINERNGFEFRAEAFDFINHPNWAAIGSAGGLNLTPTSAQFGEVTGKSNLARQLQLSLRYYF